MTKEIDMRRTRKFYASSFRGRLSTIIALGILPLAVLSGCVVTVDPVISEDDATMDSRLLGSWEQVSGSDRAVVSRTAENTYAIDYTSRKNVSRFEARLGKLGEHSVLDVWAVPGKSDKNRPDAGLLVAGHLLLDLEIGSQEIQVTALDPDAMLAALRTSDLGLDYTETDNQLVLHGTTEELRSTLSTLLGRSGVLGDTDVWRRGKERPLPVAVPCFEASAWREADQLLHRDPHWVGGDVASSVDLGGGRILWLFGNSRIDLTGTGTRKGTPRVSNSVAIQTGTNPATAKIVHYWGTDADGRPAALFPDRNDEFLSFGRAVRVQDRLVLFFSQNISTPGIGLGFESIGWTAVMVENPDAEPSAWEVRELETPANRLGVAVGVKAVFQQGDHVYGLGPQEGVKSGPVFAARWPAADVQRGDLLEPEWWAGERLGWVPNSSNTPRRPLFEHGQSGASIHVDQVTQRYIAVHSVGFGRAEVSMRAAPTLTGPWSGPQMVYRPPEYYQPKAGIHSAQAHPELAGGDLVLTYVTNAGGYPRFVRLTRCE